MNQPEEDEKGESMDHRIAEMVVERLIGRLSDEKTIDTIVSKWRSSVDKAIGQGVRKALWLLFMMLCAVAVVKFHLLEKLVGALAK